MRWLVIAMLLTTMPATAQTFDERWRPEQPTDNVLDHTVWPKIEKEKKVKVRKSKVFVCHKQYYLKRGYRYWRCRR